VIVDHGGQPGSDWLAARVSNEHVELGVIGLPDRIWVACAVAVHQLELVAETSRAFMSQRGQGWIEPRDDCIHAAVRRRRPLSLFTECENAAMDRSSGRLWRLKEESFDQFHCFCRKLSSPAIFAGLSNKSSQAICTVLSKPSLYSP
jgi:hypothetical protein